MNQIKKYTSKLFEDIKHIDEFGNEYWLARELMSVLEYSKWENFHKVIEKAIIACQTSNNNTLEHFPDIRKPIVGGTMPEDLPTPSKSLKELEIK